MSQVAWRSKYDKGLGPQVGGAPTLDTNAAATQYSNLEPFLHKAFYDRVQSGSEFKIKKAFKVFTQLIVKSQSGGSVQEGVRVVNPGDVLRCVAYDYVLKSFIFKSQRAEEFEVYFTPRLALSATSDMKNDAYFGLLLNTDIFEEALAIAGIT